MEQAKNVKKPATSGTILVWIEDYPSSLPMLRIAKRKAREMNTTWEVVHVDTSSRNRSGSDPDSRQILQTLSLAEQMGAKTIHIVAHSAREGVRQLIAERAQNGTPVAALVLNQKPRSLWHRRFYKSHEAYFSSGRFPVQVLGVDSQSGQVEHHAPQHVCCLASYSRKRD
jgi:K+-sensing histidine kinase KdpD